MSATRLSLKDVPKGDDQQLIFADLVLISGVVLGSVAGVETKVVGAGLFAFNERFLFVGQSVPRGPLLLRTGRRFLSVRVWT